MKKTLIWFLGIMVVFLIFSILAKNEKNNPSIAKKENATLEYKLAAINKGRYIPDDDISIVRFRTLLDTMTKTFPEENRQEIADGIVKAQELLKKEGISESLLNIAEGINKVFIWNKANVKFNEVTAAYIILCSRGQTHTEAISGLQSLFNSLNAR